MSVSGTRYVRRSELCADVSELRDPHRIRRAHFICYTCSGLTITLYNKWILSTHGFHFPVLMIMVHMTTNFALSAATNAVRSRVPRLARSFDQKWIGWPKFLKHVVPVGILLGFDIAATNYAFEKLSVSLTEVIKTGVTLIVMAVSFAKGKEIPSILKGVAMCVSTVGIALTSISESENIKFETVGFIAAVIATITASIRILLTAALLQETDDDQMNEEEVKGLVKRQNVFAIDDSEESSSDDPVVSMMASQQVKQQHKLDPILSLYYFAPVAAISLVPVFFGIEFQRAQSAQQLDSQHIGTTFLLLLLGAGLAFSLNVSELFVIHYSGVLTFLIASMVKFILVLWMSSALFEQHLSVLNQVGLGISVLGIGAYNVARYKEQDIERTNYLSAQYSAVITNTSSNNRRSFEMEMGVMAD